jgi:tetratricopeptide (TPR) repeat protein
MAQKPADAAPADANAWKQALYAPERVARFVKGEMTLQELHGITGPEMMEMAVTGFTMYEQGQYKQAKVIFEGLSSLDPSEGYYRTALGAVHLAEGNLDAAVKVLDEAVALDGKDLAAFVNRGEAFLRKGEIIKAAQDFKRAITLDPQGKDPLTRRARALSAAVLKSLEGEASSDSAPAAKPSTTKKSSAKR